MKDESTRSMKSSGRSWRSSSKAVDETHCTDTHSDTCSDRSSYYTAKAVEVEKLASKKQYDKILKVVSASSIEDWMPESSSIDEAVNASSSPDADSQTSSTPHYTPGQGWPCGVQTPLHVVLQYKASLPFVEELIRILKTQLEVAIPEEFPDHLGRTPLHVAIASHTCTQELAELLLSGEALMMPALHKDSQRRTPLHWACLPIVSEKKNRKFLMAQFNQKQVVNFLSLEFPEAVTMIDADGKTPMDYAKESTLAASVPRLEKCFNEYVWVAKPDIAEVADETFVVPDWMEPEVPGTQDDDDCSTIVSMGN